MQKGAYRIGIDIGSTTVKVVLLDETGQILYRDYQRHHSKSREKAVEMLSKAAQQVTGEVTVALSGSAALNVSNLTGLDFVQEVFATRVAVQSRVGDVDVVVELGGEDAKILFLTGGIEERMNGSCAGGTGAFIDQMASLLSLDLAQLDKLSFEHKEIYHIASRCGVFAKSDIQPLLNQGAVKADIAASIYQSIVSQTIAGLAQGREIKGRVCFLGGPLTFLLGLRERFVQTLELVPGETAIFPQDAQFYVAIGAALESGKFAPVSVEEIQQRLLSAQGNMNTVETMEPLFTSQAEYEEFAARHAQNSVETRDISAYAGDAYIGIDAGSTTTKLVLIDQNENLLYSYYANNGGDPLQVVKQQLTTLRELCGDRIRICGTAVTGYGEELMQNAFNADWGIVETTAHYYAAKKFNKDVDFIIDIGGQDMKCFQLKNGIVDSIMLNEACSSGCGSFIETFANALGYTCADFAKEGLLSKNPVNLGSRCTVFMNSSVKQAQNDGAGVDDISAGLSVSVVKNAVYKVIRARSAKELGENIVVQGGTFLNDAILRAFEKEIGHPVTRPNIAGLMGAYGAALYAKEKAGAHSNLISLAELADFASSSKTTFCKQCTNHCKLTVNTFPGGKRYISGNRCERALGKEAQALPCAYTFKQEALMAYRPQPGKRGKIGLPMGLGLYELLPFWHTLLTEMGFEVIHSGFTTRELYLQGQHTIPSDTVCYPAKILHGHIEKLLEDGIDKIFFPCLPYNFDQKQGDNHYNCPVVAFYPELLAANIAQLKEIQFMAPFFAPHAKSFPNEAAKYFEAELGVPKSVTKKAAKKAYAALEDYQESVYRFGDYALDWAKKNNRETIILAGRPYHVDPEINHGMNKLLTSLGMVVISEDALRPQEKFRVRVLNQWTYHSRLYAAAKYVTEHEDINLVQLVSFGCGLDAITTDEVKDILEEGNRIYTLIKIDEINNLGAAKIRLRSLIEAVRRKKEQTKIARVG